MILRYHFNVSDLPAVCSLAVEQPWMYKSISINGNTLSFGTDYYVDSYFRTADVAPYLKEGGNEVLMSLDFVSPISESIDPVARYGTEIETIYLCGDFAVNGTLAAEQPTSTWRNRNPRLNPKPMPARFECGSLDIVKEGVPDSGNVTLEGYPFYAGSFEFSYNFKLDSIDPAKRYSLAFPKVEAITVAVKLNGKALPVVFCSPWELDVTDALNAGENALEITLTGSLRNLMGPYHNVGGELSMPGPASFTGADEWPNFDPGDNDWYELRKFGKTRIWRDDYYCIPFGLMENPHLLISEK